MNNIPFAQELNELVSRHLEGGGDPNACAAALREVADDVFEEDEYEESFPVRE